MLLYLNYNLKRENWREYIFPGSRRQYYQKIWKQFPNLRTNAVLLNYITNTTIQKDSFITQMINDIIIIKFSGSIRGIHNTFDFTFRAYPDLTFEYELTTFHYLGYSTLRFLPYTNTKALAHYHTEQLEHFEQIIALDYYQKQRTVTYKKYPNGEQEQPIYDQKRYLEEISEIIPIENRQYLKKITNTKNQNNYYLLNSPLSFHNPCIYTTTIDEETYASYQNIQTKQKTKKSLY